MRRAAFVVITALSALLASHVSAASPNVGDKLSQTASPTPTPKHAQREPRWPIVYPRLLKRGATWTPLWVLPTLAPRAGQ